MDHLELKLPAASSGESSSARKNIYIRSLTPRQASGNALADRFKETDTLQEIAGLRNQYLDGLIEAQELYLELKIRKSRFFIIKSSGRRIGYFILGDGDTLLEYFLIRDHINQADEILGRIIQSFSIHKALCKSFDHALLSCCAGFQKKVNVIGIHFREFEYKKVVSMLSGITIRPAKAEDEQTIIDMNEEIFEQEEEVREYIEKGQIHLFENDREIVGFGIFARVIEGRPEFDIGMLVGKEYRRQGYGEYIIRAMADHCRQNGWRGICGCAVENTGSRRCLEKAGFIGGYRLLEFVF